MLLLEKNITKKGQIYKTTSGLEFEIDGNDKEYNIKAICNSAVYVSKSKEHLLGLYYLILWKNYPSKENTWELL